MTLFYIDLIKFEIPYTPPPPSGIGSCHNVRPDTASAAAAAQAATGAGAASLRLAGLAGRPVRPAGAA